MRNEFNECLVGVMVPDLAGPRQVAPARVRRRSVFGSGQVARDPGRACSEDARLRAVFLAGSGMSCARAGTSWWILPALVGGAASWLWILGTLA